MSIPRKEIRGIPGSGVTRAGTPSPLRPEEDGEFGEKDIGNQDQQDGPHHRSLGGLAHPKGAMFGVIAVIAAHGAHDQPKDGGLADARQDVLQRQVLDGQGVVIGGGHTHLGHSDDQASQDADDIGGHGQQRQNQHAGHDAGDHQVFHGVDRGDGEGVELVGDPHGTKLGAHAGAAPGRDHDAGHQRAQFPEK